MNLRKFYGKSRLKVTPKSIGIVIHGMCSSMHNMKNLCNALGKRNCYDEIYAININILRHRLIPKVMAKEIAEKVYHEIDNKLLSKLPASCKIDLIGHSNGGYVAIHLCGLLPHSIIKDVFTIGTPTGVLNQNRELELNRLIHIYGNRDMFKTRLPIGGDFNFGHGEYIFCFPDEGHISLHYEADSNSVADIIAFFKGSKISSNAFLDNKNMLHIWPWCRKECSGSINYTPGNIDAGFFTVCDGLHDDTLNTEINKTFNEKSLINKIIRAHGIKKSLNEAQQNILRALSEQKFNLKFNKEEIAYLEAEEKLLNKLDKQLQIKCDQYKKRIIGELKINKSKLFELMGIAEVMASKNKISTHMVREIVIALNATLKEYQSFNFKLGSISVSSRNKAKIRS